MIDRRALKNYCPQLGVTMNKNNLSYRSKVHLFFGCGLLLVFCFSVVTNLFSGQTLSAATLAALGQIRPVEYVMYFAFWYWLARGQQTSSGPAFTTLNLRDTKS